MIIIKDTIQLEEVLSLLDKEQIVAIDTETDGINGDFIALSIYSETIQCCIYLYKDLDKLEQFFADENRTFIGHNIKYDMNVLSKLGIEIKGKLWDTMIAGWLINENIPLGLKERVKLEFKYDMITYKEIVGKKKSLLEIEEEKVVAYCVQDSQYSYQLFKLYSAKLIEEKLLTIFESMFMPLVRICSKMEQVGIKINTFKLKEIEEQVTREIELLKGDIFSKAGEEFNINSPKQLGHILFEKRRLKPVKFNIKSGQPSTDVEVLEKLARRDSLCQLILDYREREKLLTTYAKALPTYADSNLRVHTSFKIGGTITGRFSSSEPNLQNISVRSYMGKEVRNCFVADKSKKLIVADYSNIELRILAHYTDDINMLTAFQNNEDLHSRTASELFGVPIQAIQKDSRERSIAKTINFGLLYGMSYKKLSRTLRIDEMTAQLYLSKYFEYYSNVNIWKDIVLNDCRCSRYVTTLLGRNRHIPDINNDDMMLRYRAERQAINSIIQGSASDIIMLAMVRLGDYISEDFNILIQVHDELVFEVSENKTDEFTTLIKKCMEKPTFKQLLKIPIVVDVSVVNKWGEK